MTSLYQVKSTNTFAFTLLTLSLSLSLVSHTKQNTLVSLSSKLFILALSLLSLLALALPPLTNHLHQSKAFTNRPLQLVSSTRFASRLIDEEARQRIEFVCCLWWFQVLWAGINVLWVVYGGIQINGCWVLWVPVVVGFCIKQWLNLWWQETGCLG